MSSPLNILYEDEVRELREDHGIEILEKIDEGSFGIVYRGLDLNDNNSLCAIKAIPRRADENFSQIETSILREFSHPNIVRFRKFCVLQQNRYIVMDFIGCGTLHQLIHERRAASEPFDEEEISLIMHHIMSAVKAIHEKNVIHRDIKPENILLGDKKDFSQLRLVDFGLSVKYQEGVSFTQYTQKCGTVLFMAPEIQTDKQYSKPVDVWSCGVILYMLQTMGRHPFKSASDSKDEYLKKLGSIDFPKNTKNSNDIQSELARDLYARMTNKDPTNRYTASQALKHPFITRKLDAHIPLSLEENARVFQSQRNFTDIIKVMFVLNMIKQKGVHLTSLQQQKMASVSSAIPAVDQSRIKQITSPIRQPRGSVKEFKSYRTFQLHEKPQPQSQPHPASPDTSRSSLTTRVPSSNQSSDSSITPQHSQSLQFSTAATSNHIDFTSSVQTYTSSSSASQHQSSSSVIPSKTYQGQPMQQPLTSFRNVQAMKSTEQQLSHNHKIISQSLTTFTLKPSAAAVSSSTSSSNKAVASQTFLTKFRRQHQYAVPSKLKGYSAEQQNTQTTDFMNKSEGLFPSIVINGTPSHTTRHKKFSPITPRADFYSASSNSNNESKSTSCTSLKKPSAVAVAVAVAAAKQKQLSKPSPPATTVGLPPRPTPDKNSLSTINYKTDVVVHQSSSTTSGRFQIKHIQPSPSSTSIKSVTTNSPSSSSSSQQKHQTQQEQQHQPSDHFTWSKNSITSCSTRETIQKSKSSLHYSPLNQDIPAAAMDNAKTIEPTTFTREPARTHNNKQLVLVDARKSQTDFGDLRSQLNKLHQLIN